MIAPFFGVGMDKVIVIVYVDDAAHARQVLAPLLARDAAGAEAPTPTQTQTHWALVACAPRMTYRVSKWVSHSTRENWRAKWADKLFAQILPALHAPAGRVTTLLARGPLAELTAQIQAEGARVVDVVDARRPRTDAHDEAPVPAAAPATSKKPWSPLRGTLGSLLTGCGALWMLALE